MLMLRLKALPGFKMNNIMNNPIINRITNEQNDEANGIVCSPCLFIRNFPLIFMIAFFFATKYFLERHVVNYVKLVRKMHPTYMLLKMFFSQKDFFISLFVPCVCYMFKCLSRGSALKAAIDILEENKRKEGLRELLFLE